MILEMASSVATKPVRRLDKLKTRAIVITISATHEDRNQISAGVCSSGFRRNNLIFMILTAVQIPPPRETNDRSRMKIAIQLFFVSTFILHAKNNCIGVETATRMRGSEAKSVGKKVVAATVPYRRIRGSYTICMSSTVLAVSIMNR